MSDIIECPDEEVVDAVLGVLRERMPDRIARINELHPDDNTISMLDLHDGYVEPALATRFPMGCVWTQQGDFDEETRVMTRDTITVRILIALRERPMTARRKMYRYLACILNIVHSDARLKDADGVPRVGRAKFVQSRYYTPTMTEGQAYEFFVGEAYLEIQQEVYRR